MTRHGGLHNTNCTCYDSIGTYDMLQENASSRASFIIPVNGHFKSAALTEACSVHMKAILRILDSYGAKADPLHVP